MKRPPSYFRRKQKSYPRECQICHLKFEKLSILVKHLNETHEKEEYVHYCEICGNAYDCKAYLSNHMKKNHGDQKRYKCTQCDMAFKNTPMLRYHEKVVHNKIFDQCDTCGKTYSTASSLKAHVKIAHEGIRKYPCKLCDKAYFQVMKTLNYFVSFYFYNILKFKS